MIIPTRAEYCARRDEGEHSHRDVGIACQHRDTCRTGGGPYEKSQPETGAGEHGEDAKRDTEPPVLVVVRGNGHDARRHHYREQVRRWVLLGEPRTDATVVRIGVWCVSHWGRSANATTKVRLDLLSDDMVVRPGLRSLATRRVHSGRHPVVGARTRS